MSTAAYSPKIINILESGEVKTEDVKGGNSPVVDVAAQFDGGEYELLCCDGREIIIFNINK